MMNNTTYASATPYKHSDQRSSDQQYENQSFDQPMTQGPMDFNGADLQRVEFDLIPKGTLLRVQMDIKPGDQKNVPPSWRDGYVTCNPKTNSVYLSCEYTIMEPGKYYGQKIWGFIGLHSDNSDKWAKIGSAFMRGILESSSGIASDDKTERAQACRKIKNFGDFRGLEFVARLDVEEHTETDKETNTEKTKSRNVIKVAITKGHKDYDKHTGYATGYATDDSASRPSASYSSSSPLSSSSSSASYNRDR